MPSPHPPRPGRPPPPDERLRIVFTHVDPQAPTRAFTFYVYVDASDRYHGAATARQGRAPRASEDLSSVAVAPCAPLRSDASAPCPRPPTCAGDACAVVRCEPAIPDVQSLVDALNASNDFSAFVRNMRKKFQQLV